jgi:putative ABC transport system permease protein
VVLTAAGLYGVMAYLVAQRTREIGVRMALGATRRQVLALMFRQAGAMTGLGIFLGVAGALLLTRSMTSLLFGVGAADPLVYVGVSALLAAVALIAVAVPSSRATRIDPLLALRDS